MSSSFSWAMHQFVLGLFEVVLGGVVLAMELALLLHVSFGVVQANFRCFKAYLDAGDFRELLVGGLDVGYELPRATLSFSCTNSRTTLPPTLVLMSTSRTGSMRRFPRF
jgi:hypothetical protein